MALEWQPTMTELQVFAWENMARRGELRRYVDPRNAKRLDAEYLLRLNQFGTSGELARRVREGVGP